jgi:hypothetical protein
MWTSKYISTLYNANVYIQIVLISWIWGFHSGDYEEYNLLGWNATYLDKSPLIFQRNANGLPLSYAVLQPRSYSSVLTFFLIMNHDTNVKVTCIQSIMQNVNIKWKCFSSSRPSYTIITSVRSPLAYVGIYSTAIYCQSTVFMSIKRHKLTTLIYKTWILKISKVWLLKYGLLSVTSNTSKSMMI